MLKLKSSLRSSSRHFIVILLWQITSPPFSLLFFFKAARYSSKLHRLFSHRENKAFDPVRAGSRLPWRKGKKRRGEGGREGDKTLTEKLHRAAWSLWHCPYCVSPPTSVQSSSHRLTKYRCGKEKKRTGVHPRKMPLYSHKAAVCTMHCHENWALYALNTHLQQKTNNTRN